MFDWFYNLFNKSTIQVQAIAKKAQDDTAETKSDDNNQSIDELEAAYKRASETVERQALNNAATTQKRIELLMDYANRAGISFRKNSDLTTILQEDPDHASPDLYIAALIANYFSKIASGKANLVSSTSIPDAYVNGKYYATGVSDAEEDQAEAEKADFKFVPTFEQFLYQAEGDAYEKFHNEIREDAVNQLREQYNKKNFEALTDTQKAEFASDPQRKDVTLTSKQEDEVNTLTTKKARKEVYGNYNEQKEAYDALISKYGVEVPNAESTLQRVIDNINATMDSNQALSTLKSAVVKLNSARAKETQPLEVSTDGDTGDSSEGTTENPEIYRSTTITDPATKSPLDIMLDEDKKKLDQNRLGKVNSIIKRIFSKNKNLVKPMQYWVNLMGQQALSNENISSNFSFNKSDKESLFDKELNSTKVHHSGNEDTLGNAKDKFAAVKDARGLLGHLFNKKGEFSINLNTMHQLLSNIEEKMKSPEYASDAKYKEYVDGLKEAIGYDRMQEIYKTAIDLLPRYTGKMKEDPQKDYTYANIAEVIENIEEKNKQETAKPSDKTDVSALKVALSELRGKRSELQKEAVSLNTLIHRTIADKSKDVLKDTMTKINKETLTHAAGADKKERADIVAKGNSEKSEAIQAYVKANTTGFTNVKDSDWGDILANNLALMQLHKQIEDWKYIKAKEFPTEESLNDFVNKNVPDEYKFAGMLHRIKNPDEIYEDVLGTSDSKDAVFNYQNILASLFGSLPTSDKKQLNEEITERTGFPMFTTAFHEDAAAKDLSSGVLNSLFDALSSDIPTDETIEYYKDLLAKKEAFRKKVEDSKEVVSDISELRQQLNNSSDADSRKQLRKEIESLEKQYKQANAWLEEGNSIEDLDKEISSLKARIAELEGQIDQAYPMRKHRRDVSEINTKGISETDVKTAFPNKEVAEIGGKYYKVQENPRTNSYRAYGAPLEGFIVLAPFKKHKKDGKTYISGANTGTTAYLYRPETKDLDEVTKIDISTLDERPVEEDYAEKIHKDYIRGVENTDPKEYEGPLDYVKSLIRYVLGGRSEEAYVSAVRELFADKKDELLAKWRAENKDNTETNEQSEDIITPTQEEEAKSAEAGFYFGIQKTAAFFKFATDTEDKYIADFDTKREELEQKNIENIQDFNYIPEEKSKVEDTADAREFSFEDFSKTLAPIYDNNAAEWGEILEVTEQVNPKMGKQLRRYLELLPENDWTAEKALRAYNSEVTGDETRNASYFWKMFKQYVWPAIMERPAVQEAKQALKANAPVGE